MFHRFRTTKGFRRRFHSARTTPPGTASLLEPLEPRLLLSGVTLITHGAQQFSSAQPSWLDVMAEGIAARAGDDTAVFKVRIDRSAGDAAITSIEMFGEGPSGTSTRNAETVIILDWADVSGVNIISNIASHSASTIAEMIAPLFFAVDPAFGVFHPFAQVPIHLIGHSRGASVVGALAHELAALGVWVDQLTTLDPHPVSNDPAIALGQNIVYADNYYQSVGGLFWIDGSPITGAYNLEHNNLIDGYAVLDGGDHADVHAYYYGTIDPASPVEVDVAIPDDWYSYSDSGPRDSVGFAWSRLGGQPRPDDGWWTADNRVPTTLTASGAQVWDNIFLTTIDHTFARQASSLPLFMMFDDINADATITLGFDTDTSPYNGWIDSSVLSGPTAALTSEGGGSLDINLPTGDLAPGQYRAFAQITNGTNTRYYYASSPVTITEAPNLSITTQSKPTKEGGGATVTITRSLNDEPLTVDLITGGDAVLGVDYELQLSGVPLLGQQVTFPAGVNTIDLMLVTLDDPLDETANELVTLGLANGDGYLVVTSQDQVEVQIQDNDPPPLAWVEGDTISEADGELAFTVHLSQASALPVVLELSFGKGRKFSALAGADFSNNAPVIVTFAPGQTQQMVTLAVIDDNMAEADENLQAKLVLPKGAAKHAKIDGKRSKVYGTILDDDAPTVTIGDLTVTEGNRGKTAVNLTVHLSHPSTVPVQVLYGTSDGSGTALDRDYTRKLGKLMFKPGQTTATIALKISGDTRFEDGEHFLVDLLQIVNAIAGDSQAIVTIANDDAIAAPPVPSGGFTGTISHEPPEPVVMGLPLFSAERKRPLVDPLALDLQHVVRIV